MDAARFDRLVSALAAARSRRVLGRLLLGLALGAGTAAGRSAAPAAAHDAGCRSIGERCRKDGDCCSETCRKRQGRRRGKCAGLGALAADCPPADSTCVDNTTLPLCHVEGDAQTRNCYPTLAGEVICAFSISCNTNDGDPATCGSDQDCVDEYGANSRCVFCASPACVGGRACARYDQ